jgi:hypothetical protein
MARPYSVDLRERVVRAVKAGGSAACIPTKPAGVSEAGHDSDLKPAAVPI